MKKGLHNYSDRKRNPFVLALFIFLAGSMYSSAALCQVDYYYGQNTSGFRLGFGVGGNWLQNNYRVNSPKPTYSVNLDYNTSEYFSVGLQAQKGSLYAANAATAPGVQPFENITNNYTSANMNLRFGLGLLANFSSQSGMADAIKRIYVGTGLGYIVSNVNFADHAVLSTYSVKHQSNALYIPLSLGTSIDLRKLTNSDKFQLNPEYQFNMVNNPYLQGFTSSYSKSKMMYYSQFAINLKYKF